MARPGLAVRVLEAGTLQAWSGKPARELHDDDALRWRACLAGARLVLDEVARASKPKGQITTVIREK